MANSYLQIPYKPRLYVSYPLFQFANGGLDYYYFGGGNSDSNAEMPQEDFIRLIQLDPSDTVTLDWDFDYASSTSYYGYGVVPKSHIRYRIPQKLLDDIFTQIKRSK